MQNAGFAGLLQTRSLRITSPGDLRSTIRQRRDLHLAAVSVHYYLTLPLGFLSRNFPVVRSVKDKLPTLIRETASDPPLLSQEWSRFVMKEFLMKNDNDS